MEKELKPSFDFEGITPVEIIEETGELLKPSETIGLFLAKSANQWIDEAKHRPIPKMLFSQLWYESELCILFADTNHGKSILAVQIANAISKGVTVPGFHIEAMKQPIVYYDFELSDKQFEGRYSCNYHDHYFFDCDFVRIEINPEANIPDGQSFEDFLNNSLEQAIIKIKAKIVIIDNLTYLRSGTETAKDALPLMKSLKALKKRHGLSILALAHVPKRDMSKPISRNDLQGSKMLINFCDSSFAIGESHSDKNIRYIKQIKARNTEVLYDSENVIICQIAKPDNFLQFEFIGFGSEYDHLRQHSNDEKQSLIDSVKELSAQGKNQRQISSELKISLGAVNKYLNFKK